MALRYKSPKHAEIIQDALRSTFQDCCTATIFPELTLDDTARSGLQSALIEKPWEDDRRFAGVSYPPAFVLAGSWHRPFKTGTGNILSLLDGQGNLLFEQAKRLHFQTRKEKPKDADPKSKATVHVEEDIVPGDEVHVLVLDKALFTFAICLDFCNVVHKGVYPQLDVDFVIVPSMGGYTTIKSHLHNASERSLNFKGRVFVVQQSEPKQRGTFGYVLDPAWSLSDIEPYLANKSKKSQSRRIWNVFLT